VPNRVNRRLSRDVENGEHIEGSLADCISGRLHLPSHRAQRVRRASRLVREYTTGCDSFIRSVPHLVLEQVRARGPPRARTLSLRSRLERKTRYQQSASTLALAQACIYAPAWLPPLQSTARLKQGSSHFDWRLSLLSACQSR